MPYYSETETKDLRLNVEEIVLSWPGVMKKMMFGSPSVRCGEKTICDDGDRRDHSYPAQ